MSSDDYNKTWEGRGNKAYGMFTRHPILTTIGAFAAICALALVLQFTAGVFNFIGDWGSQPARIASSENVRKTWREAYRLDEALTAQARIICDTAQTEGLADTVSGSVLLASKSQYSRILADYGQLVRNKLEGGLVLPKNLHDENVTLNDMLVEVRCPEATILTITGAGK